MTDVRTMTNEELINDCVFSDKMRKDASAALNKCKAELQARGLAWMEDHNVRFVKYYGTHGTASVTDALSLDIINPEKLMQAVGEGVWKTKVKAEAAVKYKCDSKFETMLKAVFTDDYDFGTTLDECFDQMCVVPDADQRKLLRRKLTGGFEKDRQTLLAVLVPDGAPEPDFDVELYCIHRIKMAELILKFLPEEGIDATLDAIKKSIIVESKTSITLDYEEED